MLQRAPTTYLTADELKQIAAIKFAEANRQGRGKTRAPQQIILIKTSAK